MHITARPYSTKDAAAWDAFVNASWNGSFLHTRRFLAYHKERFKDASLLLEAAGKLVGVLPAAVDPLLSENIISHPGATFGGIVHQGLRGQAMLQALRAAAAYYRAQGFINLRYKVVPYIFHRVPTADDLYALSQCRSYRSRCDLGAAIDFQLTPPIARRRKRGRKRAMQAGVEVVRGSTYLSDFWPLLVARLETKYGVRPTHSLAEIEQLCGLFPDIECVAALRQGQLIAGVVLFRHPLVDHMQYAAANALGHTLSALDLVLSQCLEQGRQAGKKYFSFGSSSEREGRFLNSGLYTWKTEFGAGGVVHEVYDMALCEIYGDCNDGR